jgi:hypothetical protein
MALAPHRKAMKWCRGFRIFPKWFIKINDICNSEYDFLSASIPSSKGVHVAAFGSQLMMHFLCILATRACSAALSNQKWFMKLSITQNSATHRSQSNVAALMCANIGLKSAYSTNSRAFWRFWLSIFLLWSLELLQGSRGRLLTMNY